MPIVRSIVLVTVILQSIVHGFMAIAGLFVELPPNHNHASWAAICSAAAVLILDSFSLVNER